MCSGETALSRTRVTASIDLGAGSGRVMLGRLRDDGLELREAFRFEHRAAPRGGYLRWDWAGIRAGVWRGLDAAARLAAPDRIESVGACGWAQDFGLLDAAGRLVFEPVSYRDPRTARVFEAAVRRIGADTLVRRAGSVAHPISTLMQLRAMVEQEPAVLRLAHRLLFMADLVHQALGGQAATDATLATAAQMTDVRTAAWNADLLAELEIPVRLLPEIRTAPADLGPVTAPDAPPALAGARVLLTAGHDTPAAFSVAPVDDGSVVLSSGTWSMLGCRIRAPEIPDALIHAGWALLGLVGGWGLVKGIAGLWLLQECRAAWRRAGRDVSFAELVEAARDCLPARQVFDPGDPRLLAPADMPAAIAACCRAGGQPAPETESEFTASILTSLALEYRRALDEMRSVTGRAVTAVRIIGGGVRNRLLNQLTADAVGLPVLAGPPEATALGNMLLQARWLGALPAPDRAAAWLAAACPWDTVMPAGDWADRLYPRYLELRNSGRDRKTTERSGTQELKEA